MTGTRWSKAELELLEDLTGNQPWARVLRRFNTAARQNSWPHRTDAAIRVQAENLCGSRIACGEWLRLSVVQRITGVGPPAVMRWVHNGMLPVHLEGGDGRGRYYVHRSSLRKFSLRHPHYFAGLPHSDLAALFDPGSPLVERFAAMPRQLLVGQTRPVSCLETGEEYESAAAAARAIYVTSSALRAAVYKGTPTAGLHWRYLDQEAA